MLVNGRDDQAVTRAVASLREGGGSVDGLVFDVAHPEKVQAALAEIEIGKRNYPAAIRRYERLVERSGDPLYAERLSVAKHLWNDANLPPHFQRAAESTAIARLNRPTPLTSRRPRPASRNTSMRG